MLVTIAAAMGVSLEEVAAAASLYFLLYGLMQPVWGILSDRLGRVRVMRLALLAVVVPGFLSALVPNLAILVVGRALAGGLFAAVIPSALVYIGDAVPISSRQKALADQLAAVATAIASAASWAGSLCGPLAPRLRGAGHRLGNSGPRRDGAAVAGLAVGLFGLATLAWTWVF